MNEMELKILDWIQGHLSCGLLDTVMPAVTHLGDGGMLWIGLAAVLTAFPKTRKVGLAVAAGLVLEVVCCNGILKPLVARVRPCELQPAVELLVPRPTDFSFPSGHTGASFAAASALCFRRSRLWIPAAALAALIGFSRLYLYVHYPTDVLAGMLIGILLGWAGSAVSTGIWDRRGARPC